MKSETAREFLSIVEKHVALRLSPIEYEMAYQMRVAIDRIQFAIRHIERIGPGTYQNREAAFQLLDALDRLTRAEQKFQRHFREQIGADNLPQVNAKGGED